MKFVAVALIVALAMSQSIEAGRFSIPKHNTNTDVTNPNFGQALNAFDLAFKQIMPCGFAPWNIPPLAPFTVSNFSFDYQSQAYSLVGNISNLMISGLDNFQILEWNYNESTQTLTYDVIFYKIQLLSEYMVNAMAMVAGLPLATTGKGPMNFIVKDLRGMGSFSFAQNPANASGLEITNFDEQLFLGDFINDSWNNDWNMAFNNFFNPWMSDFVKSLVQQNNFGALYSKAYLPSINNLLQNVSMDQLIQFFVQMTQQLNAVTCTL